jgi:Na+/H+-dicarboxylate symporter
MSYLVGHVAYGFDLSVSFPDNTAALSPTWDLSLPRLVGNGQAMFSALLLGVALGWWKPALAEPLAAWCDKVVGVMLKGFLYIIPLFITGFVVKMSHDQIMVSILRSYALIFVLVASAVFAYVGFIYLFVNRFNRKGFVQSIKNMLPAAIAGFGSMSSAAAMPLTILGTEKNAPRSDVARSVIPATVNVHLIGDCFAIPIFAFAVLKNFGAAEPTFFAYLIFAAYFVMAKFSVAGVPGGGILVMLPILESALGFNAEMLSLITALYILFDPVITCANIFGNGGFALVMSRFFKAKKEEGTVVA